MKEVSVINNVYQQSKKFLFENVDIPFKRKLVSANSFFYTNFNCYCYCYFCYHINIVMND